VRIVVNEGAVGNEGAGRVDIVSLLQEAGATNVHRNA
jgi:hypothetical protein